MVEKKEEPQRPRAIASLGEIADIDRTVDTLKMEVSFHSTQINSCMNLTFYAFR